MKSYLKRAGWEGRRNFQGSQGWERTINRLPDLQPGEHTIDISYPVLTWYSDRVAPQIELSSTASWTLLPSNQSSVELIHDSALESELQNAVKVLSFKENPNRLGRFTLLIDVSRTSIPIFHDVFVRDKNQEWKIGVAYPWIVPLPSGQRWSIDIPTLRSTKVDLVLRPNARLASQTMDVLKLWDKEIVIADVPVTYYAFANDNSDRARLRRGELTDVQIQCIVDGLLKDQADASKPWQRSPSDFVEDAYLMGKISPLKFGEYLGQGIVTEIKVRPRLRPGDPLPFNWHCKIDRLTLRPGANMTMVKITGTLSCRIDGQTLEKFSTERIWNPLIRAEKLATLKPGQHTLEIFLEGEFRYPNGPAIAITSIARGSFEQLSQHDSVAPLKRDPSFENWLERSVVAELEPGEKSVGVTVHLKDPPSVPFALEASIRSNSQLWPCESILIFSDSQKASTFVRGDINLNDAELILKSGAKVAVKTLSVPADVPEAELILKDLPLVLP